MNLDADWLRQCPYYIPLSHFSIDAGVAKLVSGPVLLAALTCANLCGVVRWVWWVWLACRSPRHTDVSARGHFYHCWTDTVHVHDT